jgi:hypothetical protein
MRKEWFEKCGMDIPIITVGSFDMQIDEDCNGSENSSRPYGYIYGLWGGS